MSDPDLAELLCARLCHDLISPVGALGNGLELLAAEPVVGRDDLRLLEDSARAAQAALAFFRLAFGPGGDGSTSVAAATVARTARDHLQRPRLELSLPETGSDLPRPVARLALVLLLVGTTAAPVGGTVALAPPSIDPLALVVTVTGRRVGLGEETVARLRDPSAPLPTLPREVHLALLPRLAARHGARVDVIAGEDRLAISVSA